MEKNVKKRPQTYQDIFGEDYDPNKPILSKCAQDLDVNQLVPYHDHPFRLYEGDRFDEMVNSVKNYGILIPIVVRRKDLNYEILCGHNRVNAAKESGLKEVPAIVREGLTDEEALIIVTESNLMQRSFTDMSHSERASVISVRHNAMKSQGLRTDLINEIQILSRGLESALLTSGPIGEKLRSDKQLGETFEVSARSISRYLRIDMLLDPLKKMMDEGRIVMQAGVDLSFISPTKQNIIVSEMMDNSYKLDMKKGSLIRSLNKDGKLNRDNIRQIVCGQLNKRVERDKPLTISRSLIHKYFGPKPDMKMVEVTIKKAIEYYFSLEANKNEIDFQQEDDEIEIG